MYDVWFYIFFWILGILCAMPIIIGGFIWMYFQKSIHKTQNPDKLKEES